VFIKSLRRVPGSRDVESAGLGAMGKRCVRLVSPPPLRARSKLLRVSGRDCRKSSSSSRRDCCRSLRGMRHAFLVSWQAEEAH